MKGGLVVPGNAADGHVVHSTAQCKMINCYRAKKNALEDNEFSDTIRLKPSDGDPRIKRFPGNAVDP